MSRREAGNSAMLRLVEQLGVKLSAPTPPSTPHRLPPAAPLSEVVAESAAEVNVVL